MAYSRCSCRGNRGHRRGRRQWPGGAVRGAVGRATGAARRSDRHSRPSLWLHGDHGAPPARRGLRPGGTAWPCCGGRDDIDAQHRADPVSREPCHAAWRRHRFCRGAPHYDVGCARSSASARASAIPRHGRYPAATCRNSSSVASLTVGPGAGGQPADLGRRCAGCFSDPPGACRSRTERLGGSGDLAGSRRDRRYCRPCRCDVPRPLVGADGNSEYASREELGLLMGGSSLDQKEAAHAAGA